MIEEVKTWQSRPLELVYPIVWFDALVVKVRWGSSLGDWIVVGVESSVARIRQVRGYTSRMIFSVPIDELRLVERQELEYAV